MHAKEVNSNHKFSRASARCPYASNPELENDSAGDEGLLLRRRFRDFRIGRRVGPVDKHRVSFPAAYDFEHRDHGRICYCVRRGIDLAVVLADTGRRSC